MSEPHKLQKAFLYQAEACRNLDSPFMGQACELMASHLTRDTAIGAQLYDWPGDVSPGGDSLPLRLMGCLHRLVLSGASSELSSLYPPINTNPISSADWPVFERALIAHEEQIREQLKSPPQTNEVRRSGALMPGFMTIAAAVGGRPFVMSELGASAGLNMNWDQYNYQIGATNWGCKGSDIHLAPDWSGSSLQVRDIHVADRQGCDLNPIDLSDKEARLTLLSYLWPDQIERVARTKAAIDRLKEHPISVTKMDALHWLNHRLAQPYDGHVHVIYHTIAWQYFDDQTKREGRALIEAAGRKATTNSPLAWLSLEADGQPDGAALSLQLWPNGATQYLGRADFHGRWVRWAL